MNKKAIYTIAVIFSAILICLGGFLFSKEMYSTVKDWLAADIGVNRDYFIREIGTNFDLWLNGYFGIFFRFKMFGMINWLAIPLSVYFLATIRKRERWEIGLWLVFCASSVFICVLGYKNYRYQLTLQPMIITIVVMWAWLTLKNKKKYLICGSIFFGVLILINGVHSVKHYRYYFDKAIGKSAAGEGFPYRLISYLNNEIEDDTRIWQRRQLILYYHTDKKGTDYYNEEVKYVLSRNQLNVPLKRVGYELLYEDQGYKLYKIVNKSEMPKAVDFRQLMPALVINFPGNMEIPENSIREINEMIFPLKLRGIRGDFNAKKMVVGNDSAVRIKMEKANFNEQAEIQFQYCVQEGSIDFKASPGDLVNIVARSRVQTKNFPELFIQDKTEYWSRESEILKKNIWHDVLVSKRIRDDAENACFGINWIPGAKEDWLDLKFLKIFIEN